MVVLYVKKLSVRFEENQIIDDLSFDLEKGDVLAIIGPNGAGKTVLFRALLGLLPFLGEIKWGKDIKIGYVPQKLAIEKDLPLTVMEFLRLKGATEEEVYEALQNVGFLKINNDPHHLKHHLLSAKLGQISGGEFQRVLIAYALMGHPDVLLFDEPTAGIDIGGEETIYSLLGKLNEKLGLTVLLITHDLSVISKYAEKVLCLNKEKICYGSPEEALTTEVLQELYGSKVNLYSRHEHKH